MEILIIIVVLLSLFNFAIDYLSNKLITHNEFSIGIVTFLHHLVFSMLNLFPLILFMFINNSTLFFLLFGVIVAQIMWIINNDYCAVTQFQNSLINKDYKNYKWIATMTEFIMKYISGDDWAYSDIRSVNIKTHILFGNGVLILYCLKMILKNNHK
jgi:hypothetical protein